MAESVFSQTRHDKKVKEWPLHIYSQPTQFNRKPLRLRTASFELIWLWYCTHFTALTHAGKGERRPSIFSNFGEKIRVKTITHVYLQALCHGMRGRHEACMRGATNAGLHSRGYHASAQTAMRGLQLGAAMWGRHVGPPFAGPPFGRGASMFAGPSCSRFVWVFCGRHKQFLELTYRPPHTNCGLWDRPSP